MKNVEINVTVESIKEAREFLELVEKLESEGYKVAYIIRSIDNAMFCAG